MELGWGRGVSRLFGVEGVELDLLRGDRLVGRVGFGRGFFFVGFRRRTKEVIGLDRLEEVGRGRGSVV